MQKQLQLQTYISKIRGEGIDKRLQSLHFGPVIIAVICSIDLRAVEYSSLDIAEEAAMPDRVREGSKELLASNPKGAKLQTTPAVTGS